MTLRRVVLPAPPYPTDAKYGTNTQLLLTDMCNWMKSVNGLLQNYTRLMSAPAGQQLLATNFTTNTVITGTSTGTDVANFVASFVTALTQKGIISPTVSRQSND